MRCAWNMDPKDPFNILTFCINDAEIVYHGWSFCDTHLAARLKIDQEQMNKITSEFRDHVAQSTLEINDIMGRLNAT